MLTQLTHTRPASRLQAGWGTQTLAGYPICKPIVGYPSKPWRLLGRLVPGLSGVLRFRRLSP
eukprot:scaffold265603_cov27-Prasinocladus_malaysianus.AAC.3